MCRAAPAAPQARSLSPRPVPGAGAARRPGPRLPSRPESFRARRPARCRLAPRRGPGSFPFGFRGPVPAAPLLPPPGRCAPHSPPPPLGALRPCPPALPRPAAAFAPLPAPAPWPHAPRLKDSPPGCRHIREEPRCSSAHPRLWDGRLQLSCPDSTCRGAPWAARLAPAPRSRARSAGWQGSASTLLSSGLWGPGGALLEAASNMWPWGDPCAAGVAGRACPASSSLRLA